MNILYEVPYNFDESLIKFYEKNSRFIRYVYLPPYKDDCPNTRTMLESDTKGRCYMPRSRREYERHLQSLFNAGLRFLVLWQLKDRIITPDIIDYYVGHSASGFIVASDYSARMIKRHNDSLTTVCSIVQKVRNDVHVRDFDVYDHIVLYYTFNRALDAVKTLSRLKHKLVVMPNAICHVDCPSTHHWFPTARKPFDPYKDCPVTCGNIDRSAVILPEHLSLFDDFVGGYKIQGREYSTETIKYLCHFYFNRTVYRDFIDPFLSPEMASRFKHIHENTTPEVHYNMKTPELLNTLSSYR